MKRVVEYLTKRFLNGCDMQIGDLVKDKGDSFKALEDPGVIIEVLPERYTYRWHFGLGLFKIKYDGILVRWMDKKGTTHVYPCCCVTKLELSPQAAEELKKAAEAKQVEGLPPLPDNVVDVEETLEGFPFNDTAEEGELTTVVNKPSKTKLQEQLKEIERIVAERNAQEDEGGEE